MTQPARTTFDSDWSAFVGAFLRHGRETPELLAAVIEHHPANPIGPLAKGFLLLMLAKKELRPAIQECLREALRRGAHGRDARPRLLAEGLSAWLAGDPQLAIDKIEKVIARHPLDAFAVKLSHAIRFMLGDAGGMRRSLGRVVSIYTEDTPFAGYIKGCYAFALEETGDYREAERMGLRAVGLAPDDAWGRHAVAHVLEMTGRAREGLEWLARDEGWQHCNNFGYHMLWHRALFMLELGMTREALALYDSGVRAERTDDFRDIANAASLLLRLELAGLSVGDRWEELADIAERRIDNRELAFADLHYLLALLGAGRPDAAQELAKSLLMGGTSHNDLISASIAGPAAEAFQAFTRGDHSSAVMLLGPVMPALRHIGGSHAQRDIFTQIYLESLVRCGHPLAARELGARRVARNGGNRFAETRLMAVASHRPAAVTAQLALHFTPGVPLH